MPADASAREGVAGEDDDAKVSSLNRSPPSQTTDIVSQPFRLLGLPPEIWSNIVKMAIDNEPAYNSMRTLKPTLRTNHSHQPAITSTCRTVRQETLPYFYATHFVAKWNVTRDEEELKLVGRLLRLTGQQNREAVQGLQVSDDWAYEDHVVEKDFVRRTLRSTSTWDFEFRLELCQVQSIPEGGGETCTFKVKFF